MSNKETTLLTVDKLRTVAGLALRQYYREKEGIAKRFLIALWSGVNYDYMFNLKGGQALKDDVPILKKLIADFGGFFTDLWTDNEALEIDCLSTGSECIIHNARRRQIIDSRKTPEEKQVLVDIEELLQKAESVKGQSHDGAVNDPLLLKVLELRDLAAYKQESVNELMYLSKIAGYESGNLADGETVDNAQSNGGQTIEPLEDHPQNDLVESLPVPEPLPVEAMPETKPQKPKIKRINRVKVDSHKPKRFIAGQDRTLNNGVRLWQQDDIELKISW